MVRRVAIAVCVLAIPLLAAESAMACSCAPLSSEDVRASDAAVIAKLTKVEVVPFEEPDPLEPVPADRPADYFFRIREIFKGEKRIDRDVIKVHSTVGTGGACGMNGTVGRSYGLFLDRRNHRWNGTSCGMTSPSRMRDLASGGTARVRCG